MSSKPSYEELEQRVRELEGKAAESSRMAERLSTFSSVVEQSINAVAILDPGGRVEYVNPKLLKAYGIDSDAAVGEQWRSLLSGNAALREHLQNIREAVLEEAETWWGETSEADRDGSRLWGDATLFPVRDEDGQLAHIVYVSENTAERTQVEETIQRERERFEALTEESPFGVSLIGKKGDHCYLNPRFTEIFGYDMEDIPTAEEWCQRAFPDLDHRRQFMETSTRDLRDNGAGQSHSKVFTIRCKDGSDRVISLRSVGLRSGDRLVIYEDTTAQRRLQDQLAEAQRMDSMGTLAGGIAHDFNNVLYSIIGYAELTIEDVPEGSDAHRNLRGVLKAALRARDMVKQMLTLSRKTGTEKKPIKIQTVLEEAVRLLRSSIPATIDIRSDIDGTCGPVLADSTQVHQVIVNLATNAYQAMRETGGLLELALAEEDITGVGPVPDLNPGRYLTLAVKDTGHGMDRDVMQRIFDPYFTTNSAEATGMGLAVAHGIVKGHGGGIGVRSEPGQGAEFRVYLPLLEPRTPEREMPSPEPPGVAAQHILVVDDEEQIIDIARQILERLGYRVTTHTSSLEALEAFRAGPHEFDLVITDMTMPNMTGVELTPRLLDIRPDIPIILCTGYSEIVDEERARSIGIRRFVMKPVATNEITRVVRQVLDAQN